MIRGPVTLEAVEFALFESIYVDLRPGGPDYPGHADYAKEPVKCASGASWHPTLWVVQQHHHPALSWRRELLKADPDVDTSWWTLSGWCGLCHDAYHTLLNMYVRAVAQARQFVEGTTASLAPNFAVAAENVVPPWSVRRTFGLYVRDNVAEAWKFRPAVTPYT